MRRISRARARHTRRATRLALADTPRLAPGVAFEPVAPGAAWITMLHGVPASRVSQPVVELLSAMDGETTIHDLRGRFAASEPPDSFLQLVERFRAVGLLEGDAALPPGRVSYRPPFTLQIATLRAPAVFARLHRMVIPLSSPALLWTAAAVLCLGLVAAAVQMDELIDVVTMPIPLIGLASLLIVFPLLTLLHESAHGLTLTRFGGRPRRAGFMLLYLAPAFFVDVTDGWRLPDRRQRVAVALAGPAVHALVSALALLVALAVPSSILDQTLLLLAASSAGVVLVNLIPFVRFDGYIALMSALDEPNLRGRTIADGAAFLTRALFGGPRTGKSLDRWWSVPFGLMCLTAPIALVVFVVARAVRALAGGGPVIGVLVVVFEAAVLLVGAVLLTKALCRVVRSGVSRFRFFFVVVALAGGVAVAGAVIHVPVTSTVAFSTHGHDVVLVQAGDTADVRIPAGARVELFTTGVLANERVGQGVSEPRRPEATEVDLEALVPVAADGVSVPAVVVGEVDITERGGSMPSSGQARVDLGRTSVWQALWSWSVSTPLSAFRTEAGEG